MKVYRLIFVFIFAFILSSCAHVDTNENITASITAARMLKNSNNHPEGGTLQIKQITLDEYVAKNKIKDRDKLEKMKMCFISLETKNFCPNERYKLYLANALGEKTFIDDLVVNDTGELVFTDGLPLSNLCLALNGMMKGEQVFYVLESDNQSCLAVSFTPDPIEYHWNDKAYACASILDGEATQFVICGKDFQPNEALIISSQSFDEILSCNLNADKEGHFFFMMLPAVVNQTGGAVKVAVERAESDEIGILNYFWGSEAKKRR